MDELKSHLQYLEKKRGELIKYRNDKVAAVDSYRQQPDFDKGKLHLLMKEALHAKKTISDNETLISVTKRSISGTSNAAKLELIDKKISDMEEQTLQLTEEGKLDEALQLRRKTRSLRNKIETSKSARTTRTTGARTTGSRTTGSRTTAVFTALQDITVHNSIESTGFSLSRRRSNKTMRSGSRFILDREGEVFSRRNSGVRMVHISEIGTDDPIKGFIKIDKQTRPSLLDYIETRETSQAGGRKRRRATKKRVVKKKRTKKTVVKKKRTKKRTKK